MAEPLSPKSLISQNLPLLFERRFSSHSLNNSISNLRFFSLSSLSPHSLSLPQNPDTWLTGCPHGLFLCFNPKTLSLFLLNPFTNKEISLPPLLTLRKTDCTAFYQKRAFALLFVQIGEGNWIGFGQPGFGEPDLGGAYCKDLFFINQGNLGPTHVIDAKLNAVISVIQPPNYEDLCIEIREKFGGFDYLVESNGELLRVFRKSDNDVDFKDCFFEIHRLDFGEGNFNWVKIEGIGNRVLFLERSHGFSLSSKDFAGFKLKGNCIYFTKHDFGEKYAKEKVLCRYDIDECIIEVLPCRLETSGTWIIPKFE